MDESLLDTMFMELASESRRSMLHILEQRNEKLSKIAESLDITIQEAHRNSARLTKCGLVNKNSDGLFHLTSLGHILIKQIASFSFPIQYKNYFEKHTTGEIDTKYIRRLGDLAESKQIVGMGPVLENWKRIGKEAKEFIRVITTEYPLDIAKTYVHNASTGISFHYVFGHNITVPKERDELLKKTSWRKLMTEGFIQRKMVEKVQVCITVTEKESCIFFPDLSGKIDMMSGLFSCDMTFMEWCRDYFQHVWENADSFDESKVVKI